MGSLISGSTTTGLISVPAVTDPAASEGGFHFNWAYVLVPLGAVVLAGGGVGAALFLKKRSESGEEAA